MGNIYKTTIAITLAMALVACGNNDDNNDGNNTANNANNTKDMVSQKDMTTDQGSDMSGDMSDDMASDMAADQSGGDPEVVPATADALFKYLQDRQYQTLPAEAAVHASTGPHGQVRTYVNTLLNDSLLSNNTSHPKGSASIKELYNSDGATLKGWAVSVKVDDANGDGKDWYWYEVFSTTDGSNPVADGTDVGLCSGCHSGGGVDYILTSGPFTQ